MSTSLRILAVSALLTANAAMFTGTARAADIVEAVPGGATQPVYWRGGRHYGWHAPSELIVGVRGAGPLTVPFYGAGWYPGPAHYYGPRHPLCCRAGGDAVISVRY
jgi:hypothetical protein